MSAARHPSPRASSRAAVWPADPLAARRAKAFFSSTAIFAKT
jgi:hypothetical protein